MSGDWIEKCFVVCPLLSMENNSLFNTHVSFSVSIGFVGGGAFSGGGGFTPVSLRLFEMSFGCVSEHTECHHTPAVSYSFAFQHTLILHNNSCQDTQVTVPMFPFLMRFCTHLYSAIHCQKMRNDTHVIHELRLYTTKLCQKCILICTLSTHSVLECNAWPLILPSQKLIPDTLPKFRFLLRKCS